MKQKVTVNDLISMLNEVEDKTLPIKCISIGPTEEDPSWSGKLDHNHLVVDDDGDEVMLTMNFFRA